MYCSPLTPVRVAKPPAPASIGSRVPSTPPQCPMCNAHGGSDSIKPPSPSSSHAPEVLSTTQVVRAEDRVLTPHGDRSGLDFLGRSHPASDAEGSHPGETPSSSAISGLATAFPSRGENLGLPRRTVHRSSTGLQRQAIGACPPGCASACAAYSPPSFAPLSPCAEAADDSSTRSQDEGMLACLTASMPDSPSHQHRLHRHAPPRVRRPVRCALTTS